MAASGDGTISITDLRKMKVQRSILPMQATSPALLCNRAPLGTFNACIKAMQAMLL